MELELQSEIEFIEVKSPIDRFKEQWAKQTGGISFFRQRDVILQNPDLVQYAEFAGAKGWAQPLAFALKGLFVAALVLSAFSWLITKDEGKSADLIAATQAELESQLKTEQGIIDAAQFDIDRIEKARNRASFKVALSNHLTKEEAFAQLNTIMEQAGKTQEQYKYRAQVKIQNLRAAGDGFTLAASGTPVVVALALLFAAPVFRRFMQASYGRCRLAGQADSYYLYYVSSRGVWLNLALVLVLNVALSNSAYGLGGVVEGMGSLGRILFWLAMYSALLYWFFVVSKDLYKAMQLPGLRDYTALENKVLLWMHNSFWMVFVVFEIVLLLLAYFVYLMEKAR